ncbi:MAG TPA: indole-3-glycerol phosphate synthase TrpC [Solirubrobacteraceae bacterium]|nr:indole-3-glycerol phosphate synthase TrpC [Solirubrobacteraceae bacterium]
MSETVLDGILRSTRAEIARRELEVSLGELRDRVAETDAGAGATTSSRPGFRAALTGPEIAVIAEFKRRSPSAGELRPGAEPAGMVGAYERGGAAAASVLTEGPHFGGSLADLEAAGTACGLPLLRKDFVVDPYQLYEARVAGAAAVLLIVAALEDPVLADLHAMAGELGLDVLVEVHDGEELARALAIGADLVGVNNRDLRDFGVDVRRTFELLGDVPAGVAVVSESGISTATQLRELHAAGVQAVLVGETLMRAADPEAALRELLGTGAASGGAGAPGRGEAGAPTRGDAEATARGASRASGI